MLLAEAEAEAFQGEGSAAAAAAAAAESVAASTPQQRKSQQQEQGGLSGMPGSASGPPVTPAPARRESMSLASMLRKQKASKALALIYTKSKYAGSCWCMNGM